MSPDTLHATRLALSDPFRVRRPPTDNLSVLAVPVRDTLPAVDTLASPRVISAIEPPEVCAEASVPLIAAREAEIRHEVVEHDRVAPALTSKLSHTRLPARSMLVVTMHPDDDVLELDDVDELDDVALELLVELGDGVLELDDVADPDGVALLRA
jgi:hypothetical protein